LIHIHIFVRDHAQPDGRAQQLPGSQQELRVGRPAEFFVPDHERLVEQDAALLERGREMRKQRPVQVVGNDYGGKALTGERPGIAVLQIGLNKQDSFWKDLDFAVDATTYSLFRKKARMPPATAGNVDTGPRSTSGASALPFGWLFHIWHLREVSGDTTMGEEQWRASLEY
jgi:hypothetical protein